MQGFNMGRYVPPDKDGLMTGNALHRKRTIPATVRFEMPFAVWCTSCPKPTIIGQGVRFNATKTRVGAYHSTPIWAFRFKHTACGGELEVRTDPKNTAYVVTEGGKKRDTGEGKDGEEDLEGGRKILTDGEREELRKSAFKRLERTIEDREAAKEGNERIEGLIDRAQKDWSDPYERNQRLRRSFREERKEREREAKSVEGLRQRLGLGGEDEDEDGLKILPATREDELRAGLVEFGRMTEDGEGRALARPLFGASGGARKASGRTRGTTKAEARITRRKDELVSKIAGNTRAATDPFLNSGVTKSSAVSRKLLPGVKRKRDAAREGEEEEALSANAPSGLVDYDSD